MAQVQLSLLACCYVARDAEHVAPPGGWVCKHHPALAILGLVKFLPLLIAFIASASNQQAWAIKNLFPETAAAKR